jgi:hypothetical protein
MDDNKIYCRYKADMRSVINQYKQWLSSINARDDLSSINASNDCHHLILFQMGKCFLNAILLTNYDKSIANNVKYKTGFLGEYYQMQTSVIQCC